MGQTVRNEANDCRVRIRHYADVNNPVTPPRYRNRRSEMVGVLRGDDTEELWKLCRDSANNLLELWGVEPLSEEQRQVAVQEFWNRLENNRLRLEKIRSDKRAVARASRQATRNDNMCRYKGRTTCMNPRYVNSRGRTLANCEYHWKMIRNQRKVDTTIISSK